jgi:hypothetical protein
MKHREKKITFFQKWWKVLIGVAVFIVINIAFFLLNDNQINNSIQATAVIGLILVTWFYAIQTQKLVEEEKKSLDEEKEKRRAEYGEKRIEYFMNPLFFGLKYLKANLQAIISRGPETCAPFLRDYYDKELAAAKATLSQIEDLFLTKSFMANDLFVQNIINFRDKINMSWPIGAEERGFDAISSWIKNTDAEIHRLLVAVGLEITVLETDIKKFYGYYVPTSSPWTSPNDKGRN